jgi:hypothetical protein
MSTDPASPAALERPLDHYASLGLETRRIRAENSNLALTRSMIDNMTVPVSTLPSRSCTPGGNSLRRRATSSGRSTAPGWWCRATTMLLRCRPPLPAPLARYKAFITDDLEPVHVDDEMVVMGLNSARSPPSAAGG